MAKFNLIKKKKDIGSVHGVSSSEPLASAIGLLRH